MNKKIFDAKLCREGCRQLRVIGTVFAVIMMMEAVLLPVYRTIIMANVNPDNYQASWTRNSELFTLHPIIMITFTLIVPVLTLYLFRFLNLRNACDFYHAIPQTRLCLGISYLGSVIVWTMGILWGSTLTSLILHMVLPTGVHVMFGTCILQTISFSIMCLLVIAGIFLAMTLTGNAFSNIIVTGMILFVPRTLMLILKMVVGSELTVVASDSYLTFWGNGWNLVTSLCLGMFVSTGDYVEMLTSVSGMVYTLLLTAVYLGFGIWRFNRRASESAGQAAVDDRLQLVFRLIPAFMFSLIPTVVLFCDGVKLNGEEIFELFVLYLIAVVVYFLYELVSTRKVRNLKHAMPGLLILAIMNVAAFLGMGAMKQSVLSFAPSAEEIAGVRLPAETVDLYLGAESDYNTLHLPGYLTSRRAKVELTDPEIRELVAERLKEGIDYDKNGTGSDNRGYMTVTIHAGSREVERRIGLVSSDWNTIGTVLKENSQVESAYMDLPDPSDENLRFYIDSPNSMSREDQREIYRALLEDVQDMGFLKWYQYTSEAVQDENYRQVAYLNMIYTDGLEETGSCLPISNLTPKASAAYLRILHGKQEADGSFADVLKVLDTLESMTAEGRETVWTYLSLEPYRNSESTAAAEDTTSNDFFEADLSKVENIRALRELILEQDSLSEQDSYYLAVEIRGELLYDRAGNAVSNYDEMYSSDNYDYSLCLLTAKDLDFRTYFAK